MIKQPPKQTAIARLLRHRDTTAEQLLWRWLRDRRFYSYKFRRQHPEGPYILDFFCSEANLDIELDGFQHGTPDIQSEDRKRDAYLESKGIKVLRFWNGQLKREKRVVRDTIWATLQERAPKPMPRYCRPGIAKRGEG
jgi:very-short-patch-repair endonuclease